MARPTVVIQPTTIERVGGGPLVLGVLGSPVLALLAGGPGDYWARWALMVIAADRAVPPPLTFASDPVNCTVTLDDAYVEAFRRHLIAFGFEVQG